MPDHFTQLSAGRTWYEASMEPGLSRPVKRARLERAAQQFRLLMERDLANLFPAWARQGFLDCECAIAELLIVDGFVEADTSCIIYAADESVSVLVWQHANGESTAQGESRLFQIINKLRNPVIGRASLRQRVFLLQNIGARVTTSSPSEARVCAPLRLECFLAILELVRHSASQHLAGDHPDRAKQLLLSEENGLVAAQVLETTVHNGMSAKAAALAAASGRIRGRAVALKDEYEKLLGVCEAALLIRAGDQRTSEDGAHMSSEALLEREQLAADDYRFALHCLQSNNKELEGALLVRLARYYARTTGRSQRALELYTRAVAVSNCFYPSYPTGTWYREAVEGMTACGGVPKIRKRPPPQPSRTVANSPHQPTDDEARATRKSELEAKVEVEVERLDALSTLTDRQFCDAVFRTWPPKGDELLAYVPDPQKATAKLGRLALLKAMRAYHPDKNHAHGELWRAVSGEICKAMTGRYSRSFKGEA